MTPDMTPERFKALAGAYGGDLRRWPAAERGAAQQHLSLRPGGREELDAELALDQALAGWRVPGPGAALAASIMAGAADRHHRLRRLRLWWSGLGAAGALAGGLAAGALAVSLCASPDDAASDLDAGLNTGLYGLYVLGLPLDPRAAGLAAGSGQAGPAEAAAPAPGRAP